MLGLCFFENFRRGEHLAISLKGALKEERGRTLDARDMQALFPGAEIYVIRGVTSDLKEMHKETRRQWDRYYRRYNSRELLTWSDLKEGLMREVYEEMKQ